MSYIRKPRRLPGPGTLEGVDIGATINTIVSGLGVASDIASDPYLRETICRVGQISAANKRQPVPSCPKTADGLPGGVGLRKLIKPLRAYSYAEQHPWVKPVAVAAAIGVPVLIGYWIGKGKI